MKKLYELLGKAPSKGTFGVEIEVEGANLCAPTQGWRGTRDGSLRGRYPDQSCEYVFDKPETLATSIRMIHQLSEAMKANHSRLDFSFRTSTHVHVNAQHLTYPQFLAFLYTSVLMENVLMNFCGDERINNRFCLRIQDAEFYVENLKELFRSRVSLARINEDRLRYTAINIGSVPKYGSVEFRGMRGTLDKEVLVPWLKTLSAIRDFAVNQNNPHNVHDLFVKNSPEEFVHMIVGEELFKVLNYPELKNDMRKAFSLSIELTHIYDERNFIEKPAEPKPANKFNFEQLARLNPAPRMEDFGAGFNNLIEGIQADGNPPQRAIEPRVRRNVRPAIVEWNEQPFNPEDQDL